MIGTRQVKMQWWRIHREGNEEKIWWSNTEGTITKEIRRFLKKCGWEEVGEWKWKHVEKIGEGRKEMTLNLKEDEKEEVGHKAREGWRWLQWGKF